MSHYENLPMQNKEMFLAKKFDKFDKGHYHNRKFDKFHQKIIDIFNIFAQNIDCGYMLEPPHRGGSNEYPQSMFWTKNKKNRCTPVLVYKSGI